MAQRVVFESGGTGRRRRALLVTAALLLPFFHTPAATATADHSRLPGLPTTAQARERLDGLTVAPRGSLAGYSHRRFLPEWANQQGACDTRETVLRRDGHGVSADADCRPVAGLWRSPYEGRILTSSGQIDVDHVVPLANAWRSGASRWSDARRRAFANDLTRPELIVVSESVNLDKGGRTPATWRPPITSYWCTYARAWVGVKHHYRLRVTEPEKSALADMLATCPT
ncbi:HNH endonuclease family protein [Nonomuraea sp. SBT364]|uniref:HNH endonuclease family protein n=1 Tax=Nonomuraea sp. SBT364 TaxID=1580530 RepID=UPI0007C73390|nr:HNH endonuclease family protein [Nonomuraea sp. SBT364]